MKERIGERRYERLRENTPAIKSFFDRVGPRFYSSFFALIGYRLALRRFARANHHLLGIRKDMRILDAGIGTGFLTVSLLQEAPIPVSVVGLDFSRGMLTGLECRLAELNLQPRVKLLMSDMRRMPFTDGTFDLVVTSAAMEYLPDVAEGISECGRVLRPGGSFLFIATRDSFMGKTIAATWKNKVLEPDHIRQCMQKAGMRRIDSISFPWYFPHVNWWGMILLGEKEDGS